jgi:hypothetical protein
MELVHDSTMRKLWDKWGIVLSAACIIHCFAVVILPLLLPAVEMLVHSPWVHRVFATLVIFTTPLAFLPGYRRHGLHRVLILAVAGLCLVLVGVAMDGQVDEFLSHATSIVGSMLLVSAHVWNLKHSHRHQKCCDH